MLLGTAAAAWQPLAEDSLHWSSLVSPCSLRSSTANLSATALPEHAWLRVHFVLTHNASADAPDPHMLLLDGVASHSALSLGTDHEPAPGCAGTRASRFDMFWQHTASSAELRFGRACDANSDLHRPGVHWNDLWCGDDVAWGVQDFTLTTSTGALDWDVPGVESFENVTSRLVLTGAASALTLPLSLDAALQHLDLLPTAGSSMLPLSGTLPRSLLSLTLGLSSDRMLTSTAGSSDKLKPPETIKVDVPLSGSLPPTLQKLSWQLDELRPGLSGTLPASLLWIDAAGLIGDQGKLGWQPRLSGTLPAGVLAPRSNASCAHEEVYKARYEYARAKNAAWALKSAGEYWRPHASCGAAVALPLLSGTLPSTLAEPSPLVDLAIVGTQMSGTLPHGLFAALPELTVLELNCNNFEGTWPRSTDHLQLGKVSSCYNRLDALKGLPCDYPRAPANEDTLCELRDATPREPGEPQRWYRRASADQCAPCDDNALLIFGLMIVLFVVLILVAAWAAKWLLSLQALPFVSPLLAFITFIQFVAEFRGFGNIWPPAVRRVLDFCETLFTLNLDSLNSECALGRVLFPSSFLGRRVFRLLFPLMLCHVYVMWITLRDGACWLLPRLLSTPITGRGRVMQFVMICQHEYAEELQAQEAARLALERAHAAYKGVEYAGMSRTQPDYEAAARDAPQTPKGELLRARALKRLDGSEQRAQAEAAYRKWITAWMPVFQVPAALLHLVYLLRCAMQPQSSMASGQLRFQVGELADTTVLCVMLITLLLPCLCNHLLAVLGAGPRAQSCRDVLPELALASRVGLALGFLSWLALSPALVFHDDLARLSKVLMLVLNVGAFLVPIVLPPLLSRRRPRVLTAAGAAWWSAVLGMGVYFTTFQDEWVDFWMAQSWAPFPFNYAQWVIMLCFVAFHSWHVFLRNFEDGAVVRIYMMTLSLFYVPLASTSMDMCAPWVMTGGAAGGHVGPMGGLIFAILFPIGIPALQYVALSTVQQRMITDIVTWPGKDDTGGGRLGDDAARRRYGVLYLRYEIRLPDAEIPQLYGVSGLGQWRPLGTLNGTTLPFYWTVAETTRKFAVVVTCAFMGREDQSTARCVVLILIFGVWQLLVSRIQPYAVNPVAVLGNGVQRRSLMHRFGSLDVNDVETGLAFTLILFLACTTTFINLECGWSGEPMCDTFAYLALGLLLVGVTVGALTPLLSKLEKRRLRNAIARERYYCFLSHMQASAGDQCKLIAMELFRRHLPDLAWYDQDEVMITVEGMRDGIAASQIYVLFLSPGALSRAFVIFELLIALQQKRRIVLVHGESAGAQAKVVSREVQMMPQEGSSGADASVEPPISSPAASRELVASASLDSRSSKMRHQLSEAQLRALQNPELVDTIMRFMSEKDVAAALVRLGEHKGALDGGWDQLDATWVFPGVEMKVASSPLSDQTGPAKRDDVKLRQDVEAVLGLLRGLFAKPFTSFSFPDPGPDFDARLGKLVDELRGKEGVEEAALESMDHVNLVYTHNAAFQAKVVEHLLRAAGKKVTDVTADAAYKRAPVLLVFLSAGVEKDVHVLHALRWHPEDALLLAVHEGDERKAAFFGPIERNELNGVQGEAGNVLKRLSAVESMPMQRRGYLQQAMVAAIGKRITSHMEEMRERGGLRRQSSLGSVALATVLKSRLRKHTGTPVHPDAHREDSR